MKQLRFFFILMAWVCIHTAWGQVGTSSDPLYGKRIGVIGDSYVRNHREPVEYTWHYKFAKKHGMQYFNYGRNGNCVAMPRARFGEAMYKRYKEMTDSLDYVVVIAGHNDASLLDSIGIDNYKEKLGILCEGLIEKYPSAKLFFFTCWTRKNFSGSAAEKVVDATLEVCGRYSIPVFDAARTNNPDILIMDEPTRGIDVGAKYEIYQIMIDLAKQGKGIIMISSEMPELIGMSNRILVMCNGHITGEVQGEEATQERIMSYATKF